MYNTVNDLLTAIANAIRTKTGKSEKIATQDMPAEIENIQTGGGSEEWTPITDWSYIFWATALMDNAEKILPHLADPTNIEGFARLATSKYYNVSFDLLDLFSKINFSKVTSAYNAYQYIMLPIKTEDAQDINLDIDFSNATNLSNFLGNFNYTQSSSEYAKIQKINLTIDFGGSTGNVTNFNAFLVNTTSQTLPVLQVLNLNMQKCSNSSSMLNTSSATPTLKRLTFAGSFGGSSTTNSLTLNLSTQNSLTVEAFLETMTTISENTNGKTRIFKLSAELYNSLTDEIFDLADEKGYTLSS